MRKNFIIVLFCMMPFMAFSQAKWNQSYQNYVDAYKDIAIQEMLKYNIPASITLAQGILESGAGTSDLARKGNNHFGIKCHGWTGRTVHHDDDARQECFRAYDNALQSYEDHSQFLRNSQRYASLFLLKNTDYKSWAHGLKAAGYATNPQYANLLINLIETYQLYQYDGALPSNTVVVDRISNVEHVVKMANKRYYVFARKGDTFYSLAAELGVSASKLAKYNERNKNDVLEQNDIVWLQKKAKRADASFKNRPHLVKPGESTYSVAQKYGIRLKSLYDMNNLHPEFQISAGDRLRVY